MMPSFGMYTAEGTVAAWLKPSGAYVEAGDPVLEIETEKSTLEVLAPVSGFLHQVAGPGAQVEVESLVGYILAAGESAPLSASAAAAPDQSEQRTPGNVRTETQTEREIIASPIAKRLAMEYGLDITTLKGTGPGGRIVEADVQRAIAQSEENSQNVEAHS